MMGQRPQQCFMTPILVGTDGTQKMSKSLGNYIGVAEPPEDIYGKTMSIRDDLIIDYFELLTDVPDAEIEEFRHLLDGGGVNPMELKKRLARELVVQLYDAKAAAAAEEHFERVVQKKELPEEIPELRISFKQGLPTNSAVIFRAGLAASNSQAFRLIRQGAVTIDGQKVTGNEPAYRPGSIIKVGKRRYVRVVDGDAG